MAGRLKYWGWGFETVTLSVAERDGLLSTLARDFRIVPTAENSIPTVSDINLTEPRISPPPSLGSICTQETVRTYPPQLRPVPARFDPDLRPGLRPRSRRGGLPEGMSRIWWPCSRWAGEAGAALIPYGGGSSVVGGVTPDIGDGFSGTVTVDTSRMNRVLEVDAESPSRSNPGRRPRTGARGGPEAPRRDVAALPPIVPAFHPGRVDRHPVRWPLRHPLHPHRRPGGECDHGHPGGAGSSRGVCLHPVPDRARIG